MNPEDTIAAFLFVWEEKQHLFKRTEVLESLENLQKQLIALKTESDEQIEECLETWCENHDDITDAVDRAITRKIRSSDNINTQTEDNSIKNQYPEITEVLRTRVQKTQKANDDIEG